MEEKERTERLERTFNLFVNAVQLVNLTTRLMKAMLWQLELDEERRRKEGGEKK